MIAKITGILAEVGDGSVLIERDGLCYEVLVPQYLVGELADKVGQPVVLHTLHYLEGNPGAGVMVPRLAGFATAEQMRVFQQILTADVPLIWTHEAPYKTIYNKDLRNMVTSVWGSMTPFDSVYWKDGHAPK